MHVIRKRTNELILTLLINYLLSYVIWVFFSVFGSISRWYFLTMKRFLAVKGNPLLAWGKVLLYNSIPVKYWRPFSCTLTSLEVIIREQFYSLLRLSGRVPSCIPHHSPASNPSFCIWSYKVFIYTHRERKFVRMNYTFRNSHFKGFRLKRTKCYVVMLW